jgi:hypothetical protein
MKYFTMVDYVIEGVFDTMREALADVECRKALGYTARIKLIPDTPEVREELAKEQRRRYDEAEQLVNGQIKTAQRRIMQRRAQAKANKIGLGFGMFTGVTVLVFILL